MKSSWSLPLAACSQPTKSMSPCGGRLESCFSTVLIGLATLMVSLPAKMRPTGAGQLATSRTTNEPESPPLLKSLLLPMMAI
ncbi:MAG: hypothetical protein P8Y44_01210 [Acidobacteriota bacterium]